MGKWRERSPGSGSDIVGDRHGMAWYGLMTGPTYLALLQLSRAMECWIRKGIVYLKDGFSLFDMGRRRSLFS